MDRLSICDRALHVELVVWNVTEVYHSAVYLDRPWCLRKHYLNCTGSGAISYQQRLVLEAGLLDYCGSFATISLANGRYLDRNWEDN